MEKQPGFEKSPTPPLKGPGSPKSSSSPGRRPSFIVNKEFVPSLIVFGGFVLLGYGVRYLAMRDETMGFIGAVVVLAFMCEWERRARYSFGRVRPRAHVDPLNRVKLPNPHIRPDVDMEPPTPTPWWPPDGHRSNPAAILKRAQDTIGGESAQPVGKGVMEQALINMLKSATMNKSSDQDKQPPSTDDQKPPSNDQDKQPPSADDQKPPKA